MVSGSRKDPPQRPNTATDGTNAPSSESASRAEIGTPPKSAPANTKPPTDTDAGTNTNTDSAPMARSLPTSALDLVASLDASFREQVARALKFELDGSIESLAFVDHYLTMARDERREPIVSLIAAGAGAYFGNLIIESMGGTWIGDGKEPRRLRLLLAPQLIHFSPIDQAYEAIASRALSPDDPRIGPGPAFDPSYSLRPPRPAAEGYDDDDDDGDDGDHDDDEPARPGTVAHDAQWLEERLAEFPPVPEDHFHSLTCRFETLQLMLEMLAAKHASEGRPPRTLGLSDYLTGLSAS